MIYKIPNQAPSTPPSRVSAGSACLILFLKGIHLFMIKMFSENLYSSHKWSATKRSELRRDTRLHRPTGAPSASRGDPEGSERRACQHLTDVRI